MTHWARRNLVGAWCPSVSGSDGFLLRDLSRNGNRGTLTNMAPDTDWVTSNGRYAIDLDGVDDYVTVPTRNMPFVSITSYIQLGSNSGIRQVVQKDSVERFWQFRINAGSLQFIVWNQSSSLATASGATSLLTNKWYFICGTWDGATITVFVDGIVDGSTALSGTSLYQGVDHVAYIGARPPGDYFFGQLDDVRLYDRALTASEVYSLYNGGPGYGLRQERRRKYYFATSSTVIPKFVHHYRQQGAA